MSRSRQRSESLGQEGSGVSDAMLAEKILDCRRVFDGGFLKVDALDIELANGARKVHEVVRHPGAVAIVACDNSGQLLLVRQYRTALERVTLEIPAGKLERGEEPIAAARRELAEETGYTAKHWNYMLPVATAAGYSDEIIHFIAAAELCRGLAHPDEDELIASMWMDGSELVDKVQAGLVQDSKTVIAALLYPNLTQFFCG